MEVEEYPEVMKILCLQTLLCPHPSCALSKSGNRAIFDVFRQIITINLLFFWKVQHTASLKNQDKNIVKVCRNMLSDSQERPCMVSRKGRWCHCGATVVPLWCHPGSGIKAAPQAPSICIAPSLIKTLETVT